MLPGSIGELLHISVTFAESRVPLMVIARKRGTKEATVSPLRPTDPASGALSGRSMAPRRPYPPPPLTARRGTSSFASTYFSPEIYSSDNRTQSFTRFTSPWPPQNMNA